MKLKIFTLRFSDTANGFDDKPIQEFTADKEVVEYTEHFFIRPRHVLKGVARELRVNSIPTTTPMMETT